MPSSCKDIRAALAACLQSSPCVLVERHKPSDCLRPPLVDGLPTRCQQLKRGYGDCRKGMVDMRKRFRGNQPMSVAKSLEGGEAAAAGGEEGERRGQLYAGRSAVEVVLGRTDGRGEDGGRDGDKGEGGKEGG